MNEVLQGVLPPIITPFVDGAVDWDGFRANLARWEQTGLSGYLVLGSNGENVFLDEGEKIALVKACRQGAGPSKIVMAGTGCESTRATIRLTRAAADAGADCALVITPSYYGGQMTPVRLEAHYRAVADDVPIPILLYNVPKFTGLNLSVEVVARLAHHPNIVGMKDSSGNIGQLIDLSTRVSEDFALFVGNAGAFASGLAAGAAGGILAVANVLPELCVALYDRARAHDPGAALDLQKNLVGITPLVTARFGIGGLKHAMARRGYRAGTVRPPLAMPDEAACREIDAEIDRLEGLCQGL